MTYNGSSTGQPGEGGMSVVGPSNVAVSSFDAFIIPPDQLNISATVFAGGTVAGNVAFQVPAADAPAMVLFARQFSSFSDQQVFFALA